MMRASIALVVSLAACTEHGQTPAGMPPLPEECEGHCITDELGECCDSVTCFFDDEENVWRIMICDVFPDLDPCAACGSGQLCVQSFDGTCQTSTTCVDEVVACPDNACSMECEAAYCNAPFQCQNRPPCGTESPTAFTCYGP